MWKVNTPRALIGGMKLRLKVNQSTGSHTTFRTGNPIVKRTLSFGM